MADRFNVVLFTVLGVTLLCGTVATLIAWQSPDASTKPMQAKLFETCMTLFHTEVGAIIGLLGGHAI